MANSQLHFLGHVVDLLTVETVYTKDFNKYKGVPIFYNKGGLLKFVFDFEANFRFLKRMKTVNYKLYKRGYPIDDGKIVFYDANGDELKVWAFKDAPVVYYQFKFDANGGGLIVEMIISPAIQDYGCKIHRSWHITSIEEEGYKSPVQAAEKKEKNKNLRKYQINQTGHITLCEGKIKNVGDYDILMNLKGEEIRIYDTNILPQLEKTKIVESYKVSMVKVSVKSKYDLAKVFLFSVDNSSPEWRFIRTTKNKYILGTHFSDENSPGNSELGITSSKIFSDIHSHPTKENKYTMMDEKKTLGYYLNTKNPLMPYRGLYNDWQIHRDAVDEGQIVHKKYVYMTGSTRLWKITYFGPDPQYIRAINGDFNRFFFGIF
ncbi:type VI secretion system tube protein TssD [Tenacibaculum ovolyticum]|uniref:type VI secretion system tube protein TssD n=1 Tax=Tenacibaculum ovolyticum TaxID=104270 RepID=UPI0007EC79E1|nr:type VI secretion system tube protein TssD [Tenacibaculum ovolyticum]